MTLVLCFCCKHGLCSGWYQSQTDDFDWTRYSRPTQPYNAGPSSEHGGRGKFSKLACQVFVFTNEGQFSIPRHSLKTFYTGCNYMVIYIVMT